MKLSTKERTITLANPIIVKKNTVQKRRCGVMGEISMSNANKEREDVLMFMSWIQLM